MFLKLLVAGHFTLYLTRNEGWPWDRPLPSLALFTALEATQIAGTLFAVYGILVEPIGWPLALGIWGFALVSMMIVNALKVSAYRILDARRGSK
jgi:H+-transporting ATPase